MSSNRVLRETPSVLDWLRKILATFLVLVSLGAMTAAPAFAADRAKVKIDSLIVRQSASLKSKKIAVLSKGAIVTVYGIKNNWCKINTGSKTGFVQKQFLQKITTSNNNNNNTNINNDKNDNNYSDPAPDTPDNTSDSAGTLCKGSRGDAVKYLQDRLFYLGYLTHSSIDAKFGDSTEIAVKRFQLQAGLPVTGKADAVTQTKLNASGAPRKVNIITKHWFNSNIRSLLSDGTSATIVDCATGTLIKVIKVQGTNHADMEPATAADTARLKAVYNGKWSWNTRAVILVVNGELVAASINGMPHGKDFIKSNNFKGQFCLHTTGSKTHGSSCVNGSHQSKINVASKYLQ